MDQVELNRRLKKTTVEADALSVALDADVVFFTGDLSYWTSKYFVETCRKRKNKKKNVAVVVVTAGGSADTAYRIARHLQANYAEIYAVVPGQCKSAGTLIVSGSHKIYMGDFGELGPLDVQISKKDELWESTSGLNVDEAVHALETTAQKMFVAYLAKIKRQYRSVTFRTAADLSVALVEKLLGPIAAQIDPREIGENSRAMDITKNYATRLDKTSRNFKDRESINFLVESYPDHAFVIDINEAKSIFKHVEPFTAEMSVLETSLGVLAREPIDWGIGDDGEPFDVQFLSTEPPQAPAVQQSPSATPTTQTGTPQVPAQSNTATSRNSGAS